MERAHNSLAVCLVGSALLWLAAACLPARAEGADGLAPPPAPPPEPSREGARPAEGWSLTLFPVLFYTTETRWGAGGGGWLVHRSQADNGDGLPDTLWLSAVYTQEAQTILWVIPEFYYRQGRSRLLLDLQYRRYPTRYFGLGNETEADRFERYTPLVARTQAQYTAEVGAGWHLGPYLDYRRERIVRTEPGGVLAARTVAGAEGTSLAGAGPVLRRDTRDSRFHPTLGTMLELRQAWYRSPGSEAYRFSEFRADLRGFSAVAEGHVLAMRALAASVAGAAPFSALPQLGGRFLFRGVFEGRYRDQRLLALQGEYRFPLAGRWRGVAFLAFGAVGPTGEALRHARVHSTGGAGLRYAYDAPHRIHVRLDLARAEDSTGVYLSVGEAF